MAEIKEFAAQFDFGAEYHADPSRTKLGIQPSRQEISLISQLHHSHNTIKAFRSDISMENLRSSLCPDCSSKFADAKFWDPPAHSGDYYERGPIITRRFGDIKKSSDCPMCCLICAALQQRNDRSFPAQTECIYYSRVLYGRYTSQNSFSGIQQNENHISPKPFSATKRTYRLRVSTVYQYGSLAETGDERCFQKRAYDNQDISSHEGDIMLLKNEGDKEQLFHGRKLHKSLNIPLVKEWINSCCEGCTPVGNLQSASATTSPARVINTRQLMIQEAPQCCNFAALSYTWGPKPFTQLQLTKENELQLTKPQGLEIFWARIPRTIQDAIDLCRQIGIEYLWVDALCLGKGAGYEGEKHTKDISNIFAKACLTIVGNGPDSHRGLMGVGSSCSPYRHQVSRLVGQLPLAVSKPHVDQSMSNSGWMQRLWTFDEWNVSRHLLILSYDQAFFCCKAAAMVYSEDTYSEVNLCDLVPVTSRDLPELDPFWSFYQDWDGGFDLYAAHAEEYANRHVTNEDDLSLGFSIVKKNLKNRLGSQFHYELPVESFAQALCFSILSGRRRSSSKLPSWSWQGWNVSGHCGLSYESRAGFEPLGPPNPFFYVDRSPISNSFRFVSTNNRPRPENDTAYSKFPGNELPCALAIEKLPLELKGHLIAFGALTVDLYAYKGDRKWVVVLQDGIQDDEEIGHAIIDLPDEQSNKGYFKFVLVGFCYPEREGYLDGFLLVVTPSDYENIFCRVGCCLHLEIDKARVKVKHEMIYLI